MSFTSFHPKLHICKSLSDMTSVACLLIVDIIKTEKKEAYPLSFALSGGSTPRPLYEQLRREHLHLLREERALRFFLGDERLVLNDAAESNFNAAREALLHEIPNDLLFPVEVDGAVKTAALPDTGGADAMAVAEAYERRIASLLPSKAVEEASGVSVPVFDIVLLGLGADGHTASIFPESRAEKETERAVTVAFPSPTMNPKVWRVTLSTLTITHAKHVIILASGKDKNWVMQGIVNEKPDQIPVARFLRNCKGTVTFVVDEDIAKNIDI